MSFYWYQNIPKTDLHIVPVPKLFFQTKRWFAFSKFTFSASKKIFGVALNTVLFLVWHKIFRLAQNILWLVKGQGIRYKSEKRIWKFSEKKFLKIFLSYFWLQNQEFARNLQGFWSNKVLPYYWFDVVGLFVLNGLKH